jgi:GntR family transcriptional regulator
MAKERPANLADQVAHQLRQRLQGGEWKPGTRLPTEHQLSDQYGVSRPTVRSALSQLESLGLTVTRHGLGTFATVAHEEIRADLRRLDSLTATIASYGLAPKMTFRSRLVRTATSEERERLDLPAKAAVVATERALTAGGTIVAFSYDAIDQTVFPPDFDPGRINGSLFETLERHGHKVTTAVTEVHAARGSKIGWGRRGTDPVYVLLSQVHYLASSRPVMFSRTYFIEGRFTFSLVRTR